MHSSAWPHTFHHRHCLSCNAQKSGTGQAGQTGLTGQGPKRGWFELTTLATWRPPKVLRGASTGAVAGLSPLHARPPCHHPSTLAHPTWKLLPLSLKPATTKNDPIPFRLACPGPRIGEILYYAWTSSWPLRADIRPRPALVSFFFLLSSVDRLALPLLLIDSFSSLFFFLPFPGAFTEVSCSPSRSLLHSFEAGPSSSFRHSVYSSLRFFSFFLPVRDL